MKISKLTNGLLVSLLLSASVAEANNDYPATNFQPKIIYQDTDYKHTESAPSSAKSVSTGEVSVADPDYPAANFQPEVLFTDSSYKHTKGNEGKSIRTEFIKNYAEEQVAESVSAENSDDSSNLIIGLGILAVAGFVFYSKSKTVKKSAPAKKVAVRKVAAKKSSNSVSSVDKYLEGKVGTEPSSVSKYLDERSSSVSTVSKYVAKQRVSARLASVTGVEKYLKDKG